MTSSPVTPVDNESNGKQTADINVNNSQLYYFECNLPTPFFYVKSTLMIDFTKNLTERTQCRNSIIFLSFRFYVKSILENL